MKRPTPLSMKRLHIMSAQYLIALGLESDSRTHQTMLDFMKYIWEHKDEDLYLQVPYEKIKKELKPLKP